MNTKHEPGRVTIGEHAMSRLRKRLPALAEMPAPDIEALVNYLYSDACVAELVLPHPSEKYKDQLVAFGCLGGRQVWLALSPRGAGTFALTTVLYADAHQRGSFRRALDTINARLGFPERRPPSVPLRAEAALFTRRIIAQKRRARTCAVEDAQGRR